ncbi:TOBE domain protein [compost metagenome]
MQVGIRPEFIQVREAPFDDALTARVVDVEDLGTYRILTLDLGGAPLKVRLGEDRAVPQEHAWISFPAQWLMLYADDVLLEFEP